MIDIKKSISSSKKFVSDNRVAIGVVATLVVFTVFAVRKEILMKQLVEEIRSIHDVFDYEPHYWY